MSLQLGKESIFSTAARTHVLLVRAEKLSRIHLADGQMASHPIGPFGTVLAPRLGARIRSVIRVDSHMLPQCRNVGKRSTALRTSMKFLWLKRSIASNSTNTHVITQMIRSLGGVTAEGIWTFEWSDFLVQQRD